MGTPAARKPRAKKPEVRRKKARLRDAVPRKPLGFELLGLGLVLLGILLLLATHWESGFSALLLRGFQWIFGNFGAWGIAVALILLGIALIVKHTRVQFSMTLLGMTLIFLSTISLMQVFYAAVTHQTPYCEKDFFNETPAGLIGWLVAGGLYSLFKQHILTAVVLVFLMLCGVAITTDVPLWMLLLYPFKAIFLAVRWIARTLRQRALRRAERRRTALVEALQGKRIAGAAIDVYDPEPPRPGNPLLHRENVIVTPHFCAQTEESLYNMATMVAQGVLDVLEGRQPQYLVTP